MFGSTSRLNQYLRAERAGVLIAGSRLVLLAAVVSNVDKAAWAFGQLSEPGAWSALVLALALEGALAITSYALAETVQREQPARELWAFTGLFAIMSAGANVAYFARHLTAGAGPWAWAQAILFGLAAPAIALANGILAGVLTGQEMAKTDQADEREFQIRLVEQATEQQRLTTEHARQDRLTALARVRLAKTQAAARPETQPVTVRPSPATPDAQPVAVRSEADFRAAIAAGDLDLDRLTGTAIGDWGGVTAGTGRRWKREAVRLGLASNNGKDKNA